MRPPIFVRSLSDTEKEHLESALRSKDAFVMRRAQIILASNRGERASTIARSLGCGSQTVRDAIHTFNERDLAALVAGSSRPKRTRAAFDEQSAEAVRELLHRSVREFGHDSSLWTLVVPFGNSLMLGTVMQRRMRTRAVGSRRGERGAARDHGE